MSFFSCCFRQKIIRVEDLESKSEHEERHGTETKTNEAIEYFMRQEFANDQLKNRQYIRILLLGPGESGKSTILKQMRKIYKINHQNAGYVISEGIESYINIIRQAIIQYIKILCTQHAILSNEIKNLPQLSENKNNNDNISKYQEIINARNWFVNLEGNYTFDDMSVVLNHNPDLINQMNLLWNNDLNFLQKTLEYRHKFQIADNVGYFLDRVSTIFSDDYFPTFEDYLRIRVRSTGMVSEIFQTKHEKVNYHFEFIDVGGQRSERVKWMKIVQDNISVILYVIGISEYDISCFEDHKILRIQEALNLFEQCVHNKYFDNKSLILFFNKHDLFLDKIKKKPITIAFDDFPSELNPNLDCDVIPFIFDKFMDIFKEQNIPTRMRPHFHLTSALDTDNINKVITSIQADLVKNNFKNQGFM